MIEAAGAVNLMTIHAAKGLEFPVVFVANLHLPGRSRTGGFSVIERGPNDEPVVSFGPSAATALEDQRETEELRRLLYVAVTRARDRLYLAGETDEGALRSVPRSLANLLPVSLAVMFQTLAAAESGEVRWTPESGTFDFRVCRAPVNAPAATARSHDAMPPSIPRIEPIEFSSAAIQLPHEVTDVSRHTIAAEPIATTDRVDVLDPEARSEPDSQDVRQRLLGTVVHRLLQRALDPSLDRQAIADLVPALVRPSEVVDVEDREGFARSAAALFASIRQREDVAGCSPAVSACTKCRSRSSCRVGPGCS